MDRTTTVIKAGTSDVQSSFAPVAKHFGVGTDPCPPGHGHRKGVVEKSIGYITQSWWRTARVGSPTEAQAALDRGVCRSLIRACATTSTGRVTPSWVIDVTINAHAPWRCHSSRTATDNRARTRMSSTIDALTRPFAAIGGKEPTSNAAQTQAW